MSQGLMGVLQPFSLGQAITFTCGGSCLPSVFTVSYPSPTNVSMSVSTSYQCDGAY